MGIKSKTRITSKIKKIKQTLQRPGGDKRTWVSQIRNRKTERTMRFSLRLLMLFPDQAHGRHCSAGVLSYATCIKRFNWVGEEFTSDRYQTLICQFAILMTKSEFWQRRWPQVKASNAHLFAKGTYQFYNDDHGQGLSAKSQTTL